MNIVIGLGGAGKNTLDRIVMGLQVHDIKYLYVNTDSKSIESVPEKNRIILKESDFSLIRNSFYHHIQSNLLELVTGARQCFIICGLGGSCANAIPALIEALIPIRAELHLIVFSPFVFEHVRVHKSKVQFQKISNSLININSFKKIALQDRLENHPNESLTQFLERIAIEVEQYIYRNVRTKSYD
ncbi:Cell division protein FtsZ [Zhongshania aliphaticivorans]|uniref:Cell division protein FtsZ n=1 Tax=Zhongshania aliphaticivorans TaxID=1470434 RepID=A0A5S9N8K8_9GAMM|nr:hypothetical protein [Zhongshania aliphaticivorans]CAA0079891.1 Cell division protein FtsZ [Zhongshania aliphaticivorans]CAA0085936.1 Cell division protein FtsZ [Zhongshania aliphaticivorans]